MSIFDKLKTGAPNTPAAPVAPQKVGSRRESFTFAALPESLAEMQALPEASLDTPFKTAESGCSRCPESLRRNMKTGYRSFRP